MASRSWTRTAQAFVLLWLLAWSAGCATTVPPPTRSEVVDPDYIVYLRPRGLVALDPIDDRFDIEVNRRTPPAVIQSYWLSFSISAGGNALSHRIRTMPASALGHVSFHVAGVVPVWPTIRHGQLESVVRAWQYRGFVVEVEVREDTSQGRVIYRLRESNAMLGISRAGLFELLWLRVLLVSAIVAAIVLAWNARRAGQHRRPCAMFDLTALVLVGLAAGAFSYWATLAIVPCAVVLVFVGPLTKVRVVETTRGAFVGQRWPVRWAWLSPAMLTVALTVWLLFWHYSLVLTLGFSVADFRDYLRLLAALYLLVGWAFSLAMHRALWRREANGRQTRRVIVAASVVLLVSGLMRAVDWGTFYYSAGHVDEDFWTNVFYRENLGFASRSATWWPVIALLVAIVLFALLLRLAVHFVRLYGPEGQDPIGAAGRPRVAAVFRANGLVAFLVITSVHIAWVLMSPLPARDISPSVREAFSGVPEYKFVEPLVTHAVARVPQRPDLDTAFVAKLRRAGISLNSMDPDYPLMKPSVYLDARSRDSLKPKVPRGTNLIVILAESLSSVLLDESAHGVKGLTPNFADFAAHAYTFRNLYSSDFPTIKGQLAALGSFAFDHRGLSTTSEAGNPLKSNYLFLSDVVKQHLGYTTVHLQADFGSFASTAAIFGRHHYDLIRSAEDHDLLVNARQPLTKTWGIFDEDLFGAIARALEGRTMSQPFLMTVATTDMHFPYTILHRHPRTNGSELLDAVYTEDRAFGVFWNYFKGSSWAANTMVLLTADHALVRKAIRMGGADPRLSEFDYIAGMLYVPGTDAWAGGGTDVVCTQLDLTPTLLDVLDVDVPNPFLGLSIFSDRPRYPLALGREIPLDRLSPADRQTAAAIDWTAADQERYLALLRYLAVADRVMRR